MKQNSISQLNRRRWIWVHAMSIATVFYISLFVSFMNDPGSKNIVIHLIPPVIGEVNEKSMGQKLDRSTSLQRGYF